MLCTLLISCASHDFNVTSFRLTRSDEVYDYFTYKSFADSIYLVDSAEAELTRLSWLQRWLDQNGFNNAKYEILRKDVYNKNGNIKDIFYEGRVKKASK